MQWVLIPSACSETVGSETDQGLKIPCTNNMQGMLSESGTWFIGA